MKYITYENSNNPHLRIHKEGCKHIRKNGGKGKGLYKEFDTLEDAEKYAKENATKYKNNIRNCSFCFR